MKNLWLTTKLHWVLTGAFASLMPACDSDLPSDDSESSTEESSGSEDDGASTNGSTGEGSSSSDESSGESTSSGSESSTSVSTTGTTTEGDNSGTTEDEESTTGTSTGGEDTTTGSEEDSMTESSTGGEDTTTTGSEEESTEESSTTGEDTTTTGSEEESTEESSTGGEDTATTDSEEESTETTDSDDSNNCEGWEAFAHENVWDMEVKITYRNRDVPDFIWENYVSEEASPSPLRSELKYNADRTQYDWELPYLVDRVPPLNYLVRKGEVDWRTTTVKFEQEHGKVLASQLVWFPTDATWQVLRCRRNVDFTARYEYIYDLNSSEQPDDPHVLTFELTARIKN